MNYTILNSISEKYIVIWSNVFHLGEKQKTKLSITASENNVKISIRNFVK